MRLAWRLLLAWCLLWPVAGWGQEDESLLFLGEKEVSTPSRRPQPIDESPCPITVITAPEIRRSGAITLPEALARLPGVDVMRLSEANVEISLRGFNGYTADKVLVMLDSRPLFNLADASVNWNLVPVSLEDVDRIEVLRCPGSALYGENAFLGIINIITLAPERAAATAGAGTGSGPSYAGGAGIELPGLRVSAGWLTLNRFWTTATDLDNDLVQKKGVTPLAAKATIERAFFRADREINGARLKVSGGAAMARSDFSFQENLDRSAFLMADLDFRAGRTNLTSSFRATYQDQEIMGNEAFPSGPFRDSLRMDYELQGWYDPAVNDALVFGAQYSYRHIDDDLFLSLGRGERTQEVGSVYLENQLTFLDRTGFLTTGVRMDLYSGSEAVFSPRLGLVLLLSKEQALKLGWGRAFRSPTLYDLYGRDASLAPILFLGNRDLRPESISSFNLDYLYHRPGRLKISLDLFYHDIRDMIVFKQEIFTAARREFVRENQDRGYAYGGEVEVVVYWGGQVELWGNYSHNEAFFLEDGEKIEAPFSPHDKAHFGVNLNSGNWTASIWSSHVGGYIGVSRNTPFQDRVDVKGYSTVSARIERRFGERWYVSVMMSDVLGQGHFESPSFAPVMPYYFVQLSYRSGK